MCMIVRKLCSRDPHQFFQRLETLARYVYITVCTTEGKLPGRRARVSYICTYVCAVVVEFNTYEYEVGEEVTDMYIHVSILTKYCKLV